LEKEKKIEDTSDKLSEKQKLWNELALRYKNNQSIALWQHNSVHLNEFQQALCEALLAQVSKNIQACQDW
jgi:hypothetical protein